MSNVVRQNDGDSVERVTSSNAPVWRPETDVVETAEGFRLLADLPGADSESLVVEIERNVLTIEAKTRHAEEAAKGHREYEPGDYYRTFRLGFEADPGKVEANLTDGVLRLFLPKAEANKPKRIQVQVAS